MEPSRKLSSIRRAYSGDSVFTCKGGFDTDKQPLTICYESPDGSLHRCQLPATDAQLTDLISSCQVATFGRGKQEVHDESYRKAWKLDRNRFWTSLNLAESPILPTIQRILAPDADYITAELYKLNIYTSGGFFKSHRDTPRDVNMFASLVICLDQQYTGGQLIIEHDGQRYEYGDGAGYWYAFYSDCLHEVEEVRSGTRITLTYNLYRGHHQDQQNLLVTPICQKLVHAMEEYIQGIRSPMTIGFPLKHMYVDGAHYKGRDLITFNSLKVLEDDHIGVTVQPYMVAHTTDEYQEYDSGQEDDNDELAFIPWGRFHDGAMLGEDTNKDFDYFKDCFGAKRIAVEWVQVPDNFCYEETVPSYGNEPSTETLYSAGCLLVRFEPPNGKKLKTSEHVH